MGPLSSSSTFSMSRTDSDEMRFSDSGPRDSLTRVKSYGTSGPDDDDDDDDWEFVVDDALDEVAQGEEVKASLMQMGYPEREAQAAVQAVGDDLTLALDYLESESPGSRATAVKASWSQVGKSAVIYEEPSLGQALSTNWLNPSNPCTAARKRVPAIVRSRTPVYTTALAGETAEGIALRANCSLGALLRENGMSRGTEVYEGQRLVVPQATAPADA